MLKVVLASKSPRRKEILEQLGASFVVDPPGIDETQLVGETPFDYVQRIASEKSSVVAIRHEPESIVISADTIVELDGQVLGQPKDLDDARKMLTQLLGTTHNVLTAVSINNLGRSVVGVDVSAVTMKSVTNEILDWYLATGESLGKAGSYAIQGHGAALVANCVGNTDTVIGLPVGLLTSLLSQLGLQAWLEK